MNETRRLYALTDDELADIISALDFNLAMAGGPEAHTLLRRAKEALRRVGPTLDEAVRATNGSPFNTDWYCEQVYDWPDGGKHLPDCPAREAGEEYLRVVAALRALGDA